MKLEDNKYKPDVFDRIEGFFGGAIAGLILAIISFIAALFFISVDLGLSLYLAIGSVVLFAILGSIWPKYFGWVIGLLGAFISEIFN